MADWIGVGRLRKKCPICEKPDWCGVSVDGGAVCCMRVESAKPLPNGGWLHRLDDGNGHNVEAYVKPDKPPPKIPSHTWAKRHVEYRLAYTSSGKGKFLAKQLGCSERILDEFGVGWEEPKLRYTMPMRDVYGDITGHQTRDEGGGKRSVFGSKSGLFYDPAADRLDWLFVCEGFSDTVAVADAGLYAIGRPGCLSVVDLCVSFVAKLSVVIIADVGEHGQNGAWSLAKSIKRVAKSVRVLTPPPPFNDVREWCAGEATGEDILDCCMERRPI